MTYQPKSVYVGKMVDFETYLSKFKSNGYLFLKGLSYRVLSVFGKIKI